jgi:hypothetical protein
VDLLQTRARAEIAAPELDQLDLASADVFDQAQEVIYLAFLS